MTVCSHCSKEVIKEPNTNNWYHISVPPGRNSMTFEVDGNLVTGSRYCRSHDSTVRGTNRKAKPAVIAVEREFQTIEEEIADLDRLEAEIGLSVPESIKDPRYRLRVIFYKDETNEIPLAGGVVDEYTLDIWGGTLPDYYINERKTVAAMGEVREMIIDIPEQAVIKLFSTPTTDGQPVP